MDTSHLKEILERIHGWIFSADQKTSIFLAFQGVVIALLFTDLAEWVLNFKGNLFSSLIFSSGITIVAWSIYYSISGILPKVKNEGKRSLIFFGDIAEMTIGDYKKAIFQLSASGLKNDFLNQIHISASIAKMKHVRLRRAITLFLVGLVLIGAILFY